MPQAYDDARRAFETLLATGWTTTPIQWENVPFEPPADGEGNLAPYLAFAWKPSAGGSRLITLGTTKVYRETGIIACYIHVPESTGPTLAEEYATAVEALWRQQQFEEGDSGWISTYEPSMSPGAPLDGYWVVPVVTPYRRDYR